MWFLFSDCEAEAMSFALDTNLRKKIEPSHTEPRYVLSVRGFGYRFDG